MKAIAKLFLWTGLAFLIFMFGTLAASRRVGGVASQVRWQAEKDCRARQTTLLAVDRSVWTAEQLKAFDNICAVQPLPTGMFEPEPPPQVLLWLLGIGSVLYLAAVACEGWKRGKERSWQ